MPKRYVISLTAANRVGILSSVTDALDELGADFAEISQTVVQKFFTIILAADFPDEREPHVVIDHLHDIGRPYGIVVTLKDPEQETLNDDPKSGAVVYVLTINGRDQPGVLPAISGNLAMTGIDIIGMHANRDDADHTFNMVLKLAIPDGVDPLTIPDQLQSSVGTFDLTTSIKPQD